jgi:tetratricopeptide (TPR) repeat protein
MAMEMTARNVSTIIQRERRMSKGRESLHRHSSGPSASTYRPTLAHSQHASAVIRKSVALLAVVLVSAVRVWAMTNTADNPAPRYWFRTGRSVPAEAQPMDPRVREISDRFGAGAYQRARDLAQALLDATDDAALRTEAAAFIVESHLAEGDFDGARAAAERLGDSDALACIKQLEANYRAEVGRLQHIVATSSDLAEAAEAQFLTARVHEAAYRLRVAEDSYWKVIERYPQEVWAGQALWQIVLLHRSAGDLEEALRACIWGAGEFPNSRSLARIATERITRLSRLHDRPAECRAWLLDLVRRHPETYLSAWARYRLGELHWRADRPDEAADAWQRAWENEARAREIPNLAERLAEARYCAACKARAAGEFEDALVHLAFLGSMGSTTWRAEHVPPATLALDMAECHLELGQWEEALALANRGASAARDPDANARALYLLGCTQWGMGRYDDAVGAWQRAIEHYPATEYAEKSQEKMHP